MQMFLYYHFTGKSRNIKVIDKNIEYEIGERISHTDFGEGIIISIDKSILTVAFPHPVGIKKLMKGHPNIKKI